MGPIKALTHTSSTNPLKERVHSVNKNFIRSLNFWCRQRRRCTIPQFNEFLQHEEEDGERGDIHRSSHVYRIIIRIGNRVNLRRVVGTATLCLHTCCFTLWRTTVFQILNLNHIRFRRSGKLHSQRSDNMFLQTNETQWKTIAPSQKVYKRRPLLQLWITSVEGYHISNDSFDVYRKYLSQETKGLVDWSIVSRHTFQGFLRSFVGLEQYIIIPEEIDSISNWSKPIAMLFQNREVWRISINHHVWGNRVWNFPSGEPVTLGGISLLKSLYDLNIL